MKRARSPLPDGLGEGGFRVADAAALGVGRGRLRGGDLERPHHGVRMPKGDSPLDHVGRARAYAARMPADAFFSHTTAAAIFGAPLPFDVDEQPIHVSVFAPTEPREGARVIGHRFRERFLLGTFAGFPVPVPEQAWLQLATLLSLDDLIVAGDFFVTGTEPYRGRKPLSSVAALTAAAAARRGGRGIRAARAALEEIRYGALSAQETRLRLLITRAGLPEPVLNHKVVTGYGYVGAMIDLAYPGLMIGIEYQGDDHRRTARRYRDDLVRRERLADLGWDMIYVSADDLALRPWETIERIRSRVEKALRSGKRL